MGQEVRAEGNAMRSVVYLLASLFLISACAIVRPPKVNHVVVCWLKDPGDAEQRHELIEATKMFKELPGVEYVGAGTALPSTRPVVDRSYDVAIVMRFKDRKSLEQYQQSKIHRIAVERTLKPLVARYVVYDFESE